MQSSSLLETIVGELCTHSPHYTVTNTSAGSHIVLDLTRPTRQDNNTNSEECTEMTDEEALIELADSIIANPMLLPACDTRDLDSRQTDTSWMESMISNTIVTLTLILQLHFCMAIVIQCLQTLQLIIAMLRCAQYKLLRRTWTQHLLRK